MPSTHHPALSLLIIDNNVSSLELLAGELSHLGVEVLTASDPEEGLELIFSRHPQS